MSAHYRFATQWLLDHPRHQVQAVLVDLALYPVWWPQVRAVASLGPDDAWVRCRSALPYTLDLRLHAVHRGPELLEIELSGDLRGAARWRLAADGPGTRVDFEQEVEVTRPLLALLSRPARRVLTWNHDVMMRGCHRGLVDRLAAQP